jgi:hypothetical protein
MNNTDLLTRLQVASAAHKLKRSENPIAGGFYTGAMFGYEDCADGLAI